MQKIASLPPLRVIVLKDKTGFDESKRFIDRLGRLQKQQSYPWQDIYSRHWCTTGESLATGCRRRRCRPVKLYIRRLS